MKPLHPKSLSHARIFFCRLDVARVIFLNIIIKIRTLLESFVVC